MRLDFLCSEDLPWARLSALATIGAFLFAFALSDVPPLHERLHKALGPDHECAATIFASGKCEHSACDSPSTVPHFALPRIAFLPRQIHFFSATLEFSLEHAPPTHS